MAETHIAIAGMKSIAMCACGKNCEAKEITLDLENLKEYLEIVIDLEKSHICNSN